MGMRPHMMILVLIMGPERKIMDFGMLLDMRVLHLSMRPRMGGVEVLSVSMGSWEGGLEILNLNMGPWVRKARTYSLRMGLH
jgi:hypothetical protein